MIWHALRLLAPSVFAFLLSFVIILIAWVNHHASLKLITGSSGAFVFANGLLLLTVVFIPLPTAILGDFVGTDHAAPAVLLYDGVIAVQALGWILVFGSANWSASHMRCRPSGKIFEMLTSRSACTHCSQWSRSGSRSRSLS